MMEKQYLCPSLSLSYSTFQNCCVFGKLKNPTSDKWWARFDFGDNGCVWFVKYWTLHLKDQNELCYQLWYFLMMNKRDLTLNCGIFLQESSALLLCTESHDSKKSTPTFKSRSCKLDQNCNWINSCAFCSRRFVQVNKASFLFSDPPTIPAVCSTLVMCFLCPPSSFTTSSSRHRTWWYTIVPKKKKRNKTQPICYIWCPKSSIKAAPHPQAKVYSVVCVLELSSVHSLVGQ